MPVVGCEAGDSILGESQIRRAVDGNVIVIVEIDQLSQAQMARQRGGFGGHALHQVAIRDNGIDEMIKQFLPELGCQVRLSDGHAHARGESLPQGPGRRLHSRGQTILRMTGGLASPLSEVADLLQRKIVPGEMQ